MTGNSARRVETWIRADGSDRKEVEREVAEAVRGHARGKVAEAPWADFIWNDKAVFPTRSSAERFLTQRRWPREVMAVRYTEGCAVVEKARSARLRAERKIKKIVDERMRYVRTANLCNRAKTHVHCSECGSDVAVAYMRGFVCPVCGKPVFTREVALCLRDYARQIASAEAELKEAEALIAGEGVRWLVQFDLEPEASA